MSPQKIFVILTHAFIGWVLCAATMGVGLALTSLENTLIIHAVGAPIFFSLVSLHYFFKFSYTTPLRTVLIFVGSVITVDFFVVALMINGSLDMFASLMGTWIPFALILVSSFGTGLVVRKSL